MTRRRGPNKSPPYENERDSATASSIISSAVPLCMQASKTHKFKVFAVTASEYTALEFIEGSCQNCTLSYSLCQSMFLCIEKVNLKSNSIQTKYRQGGENLYKSH